MSNIVIKIERKDSHTVTVEANKVIFTPSNNSILSTPANMDTHTLTIESGIRLVWKPN